MYDDNPAAVRMQDQASGAAIDTFGGFPFPCAVKRSGRPMTQILMEAAASIRLLLSAQKLVYWIYHSTAGPPCQYDETAESAGVNPAFSAH